MAWPLVRIDLDERSRDFQRIALHPGFPVLDRFGTNASVLRKWLGRYVAEAQWDEQTVRFLWRDDDDNSPPTVAVPATATDLRGPLKSEVDTLQAKLDTAVPKSPNERVLHAIFKERFERALAGDAKESASLFKIRAGGGWKLVWCWGYDRRRSTSAPLHVCSSESCRLAFYDDSQLRNHCPRCGKKIRTGRLLSRLVLGVFLCLLGGIGYLAWDFAGRPGFAKSGTSIRGLVVDAITGTPIANATAQLEDDKTRVKQSNPQGEFDFPFESGRAKRLLVTAPGYLAESWNPPKGPVPSDPQRIVLRGEADVLGLVIEQGTDRPISFPTIRAVGSEHRTTGDEVGLFLLPGVPGGSTQLEVAAEGYSPKRTNHEFKPGRSASLLVSLVGAAAVSGTVLDAYDRQPVAGSIVKVLDLPGESTADNKGTFRREELPGTICRFEVSAPGYFTREFERKLAASGESTLRFLLQPELMALDGEVVDSTGAVVPAAMVSVTGIDASTTTSAEGRFQFAGVRKGTRQISVSAEGYPPRTVDVDVASTGDEPFQVVLTGAGKLVGQVVDAVRKTPVSDAKIRIGDGRWKAATDDQGRFEIADLPLGSAKVEVIGRGYQSEKSEATLVAGENTFDIELRGATILSGIVISTFDQKPIAGAKVEIDGLPISKSTDADGRFRFEGIAAGPAKLSVSANAYRPATQNCETSTDTETVVQLSLRGAQKLKGNVVAQASNQPIASAEVHIAGTDHKLTTDSHGEFSLDDCPAQELRLKVSATGFLSQELDHNLTATPASVEIRLRPPHTVSGIVVDARSGKPVADARVAISGNADSVVSDVEGRFRLETQAARLYEFDVAASGYPAQTFVERAQAADSTDPGFKLLLKRESDETPVNRKEQTRSPLPGNSPPPSAAEQFGRSTQRTKDHREVEFCGIRTTADKVGFVVDCSGSMSEGVRMLRAKLELLNSVLDLHPKLSYYVAFFDSDTHPMFGRESSPPILASPVNKSRTYKWIMSIRPGSGTNPEPALGTVARMNPQAIFLLSDGIFSPLSPSLYTEFNQKKIQVNTVAFEDESGSQELATIAERTQGKYRYIAPGPIPDLYEISLTTRLFDLVLESRFDPETPAEEVHEAHLELVDLCNGNDLEPRRISTEIDARRAKNEWRRWWVENKLSPAIMHFETRLIQKNLTNPDFWWRWAALDALDKAKTRDYGIFIRKVLDTEEGIQQAARRALTRLAVDEDHGPEEGSTSEGLREAFDKWTQWWQRDKYIQGLNKKSEDELIIDFQSPDEKTRRAAVQLVANRGGSSQLQNLIQRLGDPDTQVRQIAHDALTKIAKKSMGPGDCSDLSRCQAAIKEWNKWVNEKSETQADKILRLGESFESNHRLDTAREWYRRVIQKFPNTEAAEKAAEKLKAAGLQ